MSAKTGTYETWKILEHIEQNSGNASEVITQLESKIADIDEGISEDEELGNDMGYGIQVGLLRTVLALLQKR